MPVRSYVCAHQGLEKVASKDQSGTKVRKKDLLEEGED